MRSILSVLLATVMTSLVSVPVRAADDSTPESAADRAAAFVEALVDYTADVRLDADRLATVLDNVAALEALDADDDGLSDRAWHDGRFDFGVVVGDAEYVSWCRGRGLDPDRFFRDLMRLEALTMRESALQGMAEARRQLPEQRRQMEAMREAMGEEAYAQGVAAMEQAEAMLEQSEKTVARLPQPTAAEQALLDANRDRIRAAMGELETEETEMMEPGADG